MNFKFILLLFWMIVIFSFSNQPADISSSVSDGLINKTIVKVYEITNKNATTKMKEDIVKKYSYPVRKLAHFSEYFILGILISIYLYDYVSMPNLLIYSILFCFLYSCTDEIHQYFIDGRNCSFFDVLIDSFGSVISILISFMFIKKYKKKY